MRSTSPLVVAALVATLCSRLDGQAVDADKILFRDRQDDSLQVGFAVGSRPDFLNRDAEDGTTEPALVDGHLPMTQVRIRKDNVVLLEEAFVSNGDGNASDRDCSAPFQTIVTSIGTTDG